MMLEIREIEEKEIWEGFLNGCKEKTFLDSWNWGEFQKMMGDKIWRLGIFEKNKLISAALIIRIKAKRGSFLFCPHGPNTRISNCQFPISKQEILKKLLEEVKKIAREERASFIRISPIWERNEDNIKIFKDFNFLEAPIHMHPELTWELDISLPKETLLMKMRKTTRYLIRQAQNNSDVRIDKSREVEDVERFNKLYQSTVDRHQFVPFSLSYLKNEFLAFSPDDQVLIFLGKYKEELIASAIVIFWQEMAFYHQGASFLKYPKIPVSYLLQWEAIKEAKNRGYRFYNFWGIASTDLPKHPWAGLSLFKKGFGGYKKEYVKTQDLPLSPRYLLNFLIEVLRKQKRGL